MLHADHRPYGSPLYELYDQKIGCIAIWGHLIFLLGFKNTNNAVFVRIAHPTWYLFFNIHWMLVNYTFIRWGHMQGCLCISDEWLRFPLAMDGIPSDTSLFEKLRAWREWSGQSIHRTVWTTPEIINSLYIFTNSYWKWFKNIYYIYVLHLKTLQLVCGNEKALVLCSPTAIITKFLPIRSHGTCDVIENAIGITKEKVKITPWIAH